MEFKPEYPKIKTAASGMMNMNTGGILHIDEIEKIYPHFIYYVFDPRDQARKDYLEYGPKIGTTYMMRSRLLDTMRMAGDMAGDAAIKLNCPIHWILYSGPPGYVTASFIKKILSIYAVDIDYYLHTVTRSGEEQAVIQLIKEWIAKQ